MKFLEELTGIVQKKQTLGETARDMKSLAGTQAKMSLLKGKQKLLEQKMGARLVQLDLRGRDAVLDQLLEEYAGLERQLSRLDRSNIIEGVFTDHPSGIMKVCPVCGCTYPDELPACPDCGN